MIELSHQDDGGMTLAYGGDTWNTAVYLSRLGVDVSYVTAIGDDPYSDDMLKKWAEEGVGSSHLIRAQNRMPGLYAIRTDEKGERSFYYWRDQAPAQDLFQFPEFARLRTDLEQAQLIFVSGISLSLYSETDRQTLYEVLDSQRSQGGKVMFDTNHRPTRWRSNDEARATYDEILCRVDIALPTIEDEETLYGDVDAAACCTRLHDKGIEEVVVKMGEEGCHVSCDGLSQAVPLPRRRRAFDTTGAGDAFNGAYLAARLNGKDAFMAAGLAHILAGEVIQHRGAIISMEYMPEINI